MSEKFNVKLRTAVNALSYHEIHYIFAFPNPFDIVYSIKSFCTL